MSFFYVFQRFIWPFLLVILFYLLSRKRRDAIAALLESSAIRLLLLIPAALTNLFFGTIAARIIAAETTITGLAPLLAGIWLGVRLGPGGSLRPLLALLIYPFNIFYAPTLVIGSLLGVWLSRKERFSKFSYRVRTGDIRPLQFVPLLLVYAFVYWGSPVYWVKVLAYWGLPAFLSLPAYLYLLTVVAVLIIAGVLFVLGEKALSKVGKREKPIEATKIESKPELEKEKYVETAEIEGKPVAEKKPQPGASKGRFGKGRVILSVVLLFFGFLCFYRIGGLSYDPFRGFDPGVAGMLVIGMILMFFSIGSVLLIAAGLIMKKRWGWKIFASVVIVALAIGYIQEPAAINQLEKIEAEKQREAEKTRAESLADAITLKEGNPGVLWAKKADDCRVYENIVYLVNDKNLSAVDIKTGRVLWTTELPNRPSLDRWDPYYATSEVIVLKADGEEGEEGSRLMAIDAQTGKVKSPVSIEADLSDDKIVAYDVKTKEEKWTFKPPDIPSQAKERDVAVRVRYLDDEIALIDLYSTAGADIYVADIYVLDVQSGKMKLHFKNSLGREARIDDHEAIYRVDGLLIFQSVKSESEGREKRAVQILDLGNGKEKWSFQREYITDVRVDIKGGTVELWDGREAGIGDYMVDNYYALDLLTGKVKSKISSKEKPAPSTIKAEIEEEIEINEEMSPAYFTYKGKKYKSPSLISSGIEYMFVEPLYGGEFLMVQVENHIYCVKP